MTAARRRAAIWALVACVVVNLTAQMYGWTFRAFLASVAAGAATFYFLGGDQ